MKVFHSFILSLFVCFSLFSPASLVQATEPVQSIEAMPDRAQFLIIIDDSGSMSISDPNRLAVLAAKSFLHLLSDDDRVVIIGMNQLHGMDKKKPESIRLHDRQSALEISKVELQENTSDEKYLASYSPQKTTPCTSALENAKILLNHWDKNNPERNKTRQILMFMTDGVCDKEPIKASEWKNEITSISENRLQFFLVLFSGVVELNKKLNEYANNTLEVSLPSTDKQAVQLKTMTEAFASVFSFARGYSLEYLESIQSTKSTKDQSRKYPKAEKVHVLAFKVKDETPLKYEILNEQGKRITRELHEQPTGTLIFSPPVRNNITIKYEYLAVQITPDGLPFQFEFPVNTHYIVVPDYRRLETKIIVTEGRCDTSWSIEKAEENKTLDVDVGTQYCIRMGLKSSKGYLVSGEDLALKYQPKLQKPDDLCDLEKDHCAFSTQAGIEQEGTLLLSGKIVIGKEATEKEATGKDTFEIPARPWTLSLIKKSLSAKIVASQNLENIPAGDKRTFEVEFSGKFPSNLQLAFDTHPSDSCLVRFGLDEERRTTKTNDKGGYEEVFAISPGTIDKPERKTFVIETKRCRGGSSFSGRVTFRIMTKSPSLNTDPSIELTYRIRQTSFWDYYGALIIKIAILLFLFSVLVCFIRGWMMPMRIPKNKEYWFFYANRENVEKADPAFANPTDQFGAKPMRTKLRDSFGWYRNPFVAINSRISWLGPEFALEYCSIGNKEGFYVVQKSGFQLASVNITDLQDSEHAFQTIDFYTPRPTISAFFLCRFYARLFGRLRSVRFSKRMIETGKWYRISSGETEFFFKIGSDPNTLSEDI